MAWKSAAVKNYVKGLSPWWQRGIVLVLLLPVSVLGVLLWQVPAADPLTVSSLLVDRVLEALTLFVLPVAVVLLIVGPWWLARVAMVAGMLVSVVIGASTSLAATQPPVVPWRSAVAFVTLAAGGVLLVWSLREKLSATRWTVPLVASLSLLPVVQFWHSTSFVPEHLNTSVGVTAQIVGQKVADGGAHGVVDIEVHNNGDVQALILASEVITCARSGPTNPKVLEQLYTDPDCRTNVIFKNLAELDSHSSWKLRRVFERPPLLGPDHTIKLVQVTVLLWYSRLDRLRVDLASEQDFNSHAPCMPEATLTKYEVKPESRYRGAVQKPRWLLYLAPPPPSNGGDNNNTSDRDVGGDSGDGGDRYFALSTEDEPLCGQDGLPMPSRYDISGYVGQKETRLNFDDWLAEPTKR